MTTTTTDLDAIPHPAGAVQVAEWYDVETDDPARYFRGATSIIKRHSRDDIVVQIDGTQYADGDVRRIITVADGVVEALVDLTGVDARRLGLALIAAADEFDGGTR